MAANSKIEWTDHTFNPWWGCVKVSPACDNCYAETWARRTGHAVWGTRAERRFLSASYWRQPRKWNQEAVRSGARFRVFCASMADAFEWNSALTPWRQKLWRLIEETPALDWLLLTKRPHLAGRLTPWGDEWPSNVWLGSTVEDQARARKRLPQLARVPAKVRFLSCEPLLSQVDLDPWLENGVINWVIAGGESGRGARPSDPRWFLGLRDQCVKHDVAFHFKQWGDWAPVDAVKAVPSSATVVTDSFSTPLARFGKHRSGRNLNGQTWDGLPLVA